MPENVPPKETAAADGLDPNEQAPGVPRGSILGPAADVPAGQPGSVQQAPDETDEVEAVDNTNLWEGGMKRSEPPAKGDKTK
jgi:hypothetical protein